MHNPFFFPQKTYCSKLKLFFRVSVPLFALIIQIGLGMKLVMPIQEMQTDLFSQSSYNLILLISQLPNCRLGRVPILSYCMITITVESFKCLVVILTMYIRK